MGNKSSQLNSNNKPKVFPLNWKPEDFFFKNKNITRIILSYLDVKDLTFMLGVNKFFYFEIEEKKYFKKAFFSFLGDSVLVLPPEIGYQSYRSLAEAAYLSERGKLKELRKCTTFQFAQQVYP